MQGSLHVITFLVHTTYCVGLLDEETEIWEGEMNAIQSVKQMKEYTLELCRP